MKKMKFTITVVTFVVLVFSLLPSNGGSPSLELTLLTNSENPRRDIVATQVVETLNNYQHISITYETLPFDELVNDRMFQNNFDLVLIGVSYPIASTPYGYLEILSTDFWESIHGYSNDYVDAVYEEWTNDMPDFNNPSPEVSEQLDTLDQIFADEIPFFPMVSYANDDIATVIDSLWINHNHPKLSIKEVRQGLSSLVPHDLYDGLLDPSVEFTTANSYISGVSQYARPDTLEGEEFYFETNQGRSFGLMIAALTKKSEI